MTSFLRLVVLPGLFLAVAMVVEAHAPAPEKSRRHSDAERLVAALLLKQEGWGKLTKRGWEDESIESLIASARILKSIWPPPARLDAEATAAREKEAPESTDARLPEGELVDLRGEADQILKRARELIKETVVDARKIAAYELLIADVEKMIFKGPGLGPFKAVKRSIAAGQSHTYRLRWQQQSHAVTAFLASQTMNLEVIHEESSHVFFRGETLGVAAWFVAAGPGKPGTGVVLITVRVINRTKSPGTYILGAE